METVKDKINYVIRKSFEIEAANPYYHVQLNIESTDPALNLEFQKHLVSLADKYFLDELCYILREPTNKTLEEIYDLLLHSDWIFSGICIVNHSMFKIYEWESWDDGYVEGYCRFSAQDGKDYFIFSYIRMKHLQDILTRWINELKLLE